MVVALDLVQLAALVVIIVGVFMSLPIGWALVVNGSIVLGAAIMTERKADG